MRIAIGVVEVGVDPVDQPFRNGVLEVLRLFVNLLPRQPKRLGKKQLDQPVASQHGQCQAPAFGPQAHAVMRFVLHQPGLGGSVLIAHIDRSTGADCDAEEGRVLTH